MNEASLRDQSEAGTSISGQIGSHTLGGGHVINISPMKQSLSKYCSDKMGPSAGKKGTYLGNDGAGGSTI